MRLASLVIGVAFGLLMGALVFPRLEVVVPVVIRLDTGEVSRASFFDVMMSLDPQDSASGWVAMVRDRKCDYLERVGGLPVEHVADLVIMLDLAARGWTATDQFPTWIQYRDWVITRKKESYR